ncbi:blood vessel epicardial substance-like isoform X2 [Cimex lectularius]|uniref:POPDC1-3 domain-containing protein n=1 Tax=Cimex lectularius TaxID=79782 RepID=A0A8I6RL19_CIMLE|nr:blood vessel epicardial substance-like isoform X2 [Cimex lectularius]
MENCSLSLDNCTDLFLETNSTYESDTFLPQQICGEWEPAQHNLFQLSNLFFAAAFLVPRSYKQGIIILRALLSAGFFVQAVWSGVHVCSGDIVIWATVLGFLNLLHTVALFVRLIPPSLSPELTELYTRMFSPLKVSRKHFKELTKEASVLMLDPGDAYAVEEVTNADDRLSILLKGKLKVTCDSIHLHYISSYQFIDSPEWEAGHVTSDELFQVTITAEEESLYLCWPKLKLARVLRHRPTLKIILSNLIDESPLNLTQHEWWQPVVANQFLESSPFPSAIPPPINLMPVAPPTLKRSSIKRPREVKFEESNV